MKKRIFLEAILTLVLVASLRPAMPAAAQEGDVSETAAIPAAETDPVPERPFQLPFAELSSPDTWLMAQPYGNTTGAYRQRFTTYGASGGIHFGVDLSAPCGTELVAVADGVVFQVDGPFGSPPHNLMIDHPQFGFASMYGHLLEAPDLVPGQRVKQGEVVAKVGDSAELCYRRPHVHLEFRDLDYHARKYNPTMLIDAKWDNLALVGPSGRDFARDLSDPRKWQSLFDQPEVQTGGPIVNDFANPWPIDWQKGIVTNGPPITKTGTLIDAGQGSPSIKARSAATVGRQLTAGECCTQLYWNKESNQVRFIDQVVPGAPLGVWGVNVTTPNAQPELVTDRLGLYSPDGTLIAYPDPEQSLVVVERLADGQAWTIDTQERGLVFTPDSQRVFWMTYDQDQPWDTRFETMWIADFDGSDARVLLQGRRIDPIAWLPNDALLMARRVGGSSDEELFTLSLTDGRQTELLTVPNMRGVTLNEDRRYLVYYTQLEANPDENGVWLLDLNDRKPTPQKLPFFGAYRWRDNERLVYVPFDPEASEHNFYEYNVVSGRDRKLFPDGTGLIIANNDWRVSPDGKRIALLASTGSELDGIWMLDID